MARPHRLDVVTDLDGAESGVRLPEQPIVRWGYVRLGVIALLLAACGSSAGIPDPTDPPEATNAWPNDYGVEVCLARSHLNEAAAHLDDAVEAAGSYDLDAAEAAFKDMIASAAEAQDELDLAPTWAGGQSLVVYLTAAADNLRKGASLYKLAISSGDTSGTDDATTFIKAGIARLERADLAYASLGIDTGFECPYD